MDTVEVGPVSVNSGETGTATAWNRDTKKIMARGRRTTNSTGSASLTLVPVHRLDDIALVQGHLYRVSTSTVTLDGTQAADAIRVTITYTTDGTTPTISSPTLPGGLAEIVQANISFSENVAISTTYTPAGASEQLSLLVCVSRATGSGTVQILADGTNNILELLVEDLGVDPGDTGTDL